MTLLNTQLERLVQNAKLVRSPEFLKVEETYQDLFKEHRFRLRPSVGSVSLVSCAAATPQLGFSKIQTALQLESKLRALREDPSKLAKPCRSTPEKELQAWLISEAMTANGRMESIERVLDDGHSYWFVSDEIALAHQPEGGTTEKIVADLLLVREDGLGGIEFVNVELKYERNTGTYKQVENFMKAFREPEGIALWRDFVETMLGGRERTWKDTASCRGLVIWPSASAPRESTIHLVNDYKEKRGIDTIGYSGPEYRLHPEPSV